MELREERSESVGQYFLVAAVWSFHASGFVPWTDPWPVFYAFSVPFFHTGVSLCCFWCHLTAR